MITITNRINRIARVLPVAVVAWLVLAPGPATAQNDWQFSIRTSVPSSTAPPARRRRSNATGPRSPRSSRSGSTTSILPPPGPVPSATATAPAVVDEATKTSATGSRRLLSPRHRDGGSGLPVPSRPDVRCSPPGFRSLGGVCAPASCLRWPPTPARGHGQPLVHWGEQVPHRARRHGRPEVRPPPSGHTVAVAVTGRADGSWMARQR
jgi:hypothetical protein